MTTSNPNSARQRVIQYLQSNSGNEVTASDIVRDLQIHRTLANTTLAGLKGMNGLSRLRAGVYRYDPSVPKVWVAGVNNRKRSAKKNNKAAAEAATETAKTGNQDLVLAMPKGFTEVGTLVKDDRGNFMVIRRVPSAVVRHLV